jgi:hypothetical protein
MYCDPINPVVNPIPVLYSRYTRDNIIFLYNISNFDSYLQVFWLQFCMHSYLLHEYYIFFSHHPLWFDHLNNMWWRVQAVRSSLCSFFPTSYYLLSLRSKYTYTLHIIRFLNRLNVCSSLRVREKASHSFKVTGIIIVLHILTSRLLIGNGSQAFC